MEEKEILNVVEFFGGIGAIRKALIRQNIPHKVLDYVEIDEFAVKSYNAMFDEHFEPQDISKWDKDLPVDLIMHGSPCFVAGTKINTINGLKNIEDIQVGDLVLTHTHKYQKVLKIGHNENKEVLKITNKHVPPEFKRITLVTPNHPFYVITPTKEQVAALKDEGELTYEIEPYWKAVGELTENDYVGFLYNDKVTAIKYNNGKVDVEIPTKFISVKELNIEKVSKTYTVYNMEVENDNSYTANGYIVHNCQDFSIAGLQAGGDEGSGTRSSLMYETLKNVERLKPKYVIWENVDALTDENNIHNFNKYLGIMEELGYNNYWQELNSKDYGIPQNRARVFTVSIRKDINGKKFIFPKKKLLKTTLKDLLEKDVDEKYYLSDKKINEISSWNSQQKPFERVLGKNSISPTLTARGAGEEHAGMITYSEDFDNTTNVQQQLEQQRVLNKKEQLCDYMVENNLVEPYDVINHGYTEHRFETLNKGKDLVMSKNIAPTITTRPDELGVTVNKPKNTSGLRIRKLTPKECWRLMGFDDEDFEKAEKVNSNAQLYKQAGNSIVVNVLEAILHSLFEINEKHFFKFPDKQFLNKSYKDFLEEEYDKDLVVLSEHELTMVKDFGAPYSFGGMVVKEDLYPTITASYGKVSGNSGKIPCKEGYRILTPREAWRLMGFDDEDYDKASKVNGPVQLYKQAGNSIVVDVLEAILSNLFDINKKQQEYRIYRQHAFIDLIVKTLLLPKSVDEDGNANVEFWLHGTGGSFFMIIDKYIELEKIVSKNKFAAGIVNQFAIKIIEIAIIKATELEFTTKDAKKLDIHIDEIMSLVSSNARKCIINENAKNQLKQEIRNAIQVLRKVKIRFRNADGEYIEMKICKSTTKLDNDVLHFKFSDGLNLILKDEGINTEIPSELLKFNEKYSPNSYLILKKVLSSLGTETEATISIKELYKYCVTLPRVEDVKRTNRAYSQRIRRPLEEALNSISAITWEYEDTEDMTFAKWLNTNIRIRRKNDAKVA